MRERKLDREKERKRGTSTLTDVAETLETQTLQKHRETER